MKSLIRKILIGNNTISEYVTVTEQEGFREKVWLDTGHKLIDITQTQWPLCIEPVIMGIWINKEDLNGWPVQNTSYKIYFLAGTTTTPSKNAVADMTLSFFNSIEENNGTLLLLKVQQSNTHHLDAVRRYLIFKRYYQKEGLTFPQFKSFVAAYSYPRRIRLVSFREGNDYFNLFPMDLVGDISSKGRYVFGLRHSNIALSKIIATGRLVIIEVPFQYKDIIYRLGKHHSSVPPSLSSLPFETVQSSNWGFYVPVWAEGYKEIRISQTINMGSHMLMWGEPVAEKALTNPAGHLYLLHFLHWLQEKNRGHVHRVI